MFKWYESGCLDLYLFIKKKYLLLYILNFFVALSMLLWFYFNKTLKMNKLRENKMKRKENGQEDIGMFCNFYSY